MEIRRGCDRGLEIRRGGDRGLEAFVAEEKWSQGGHWGVTRPGGRRRQQPGGRQAPARGREGACGPRAAGSRDASQDVEGRRQGASGGRRRRLRWPNPSRLLWIEPRQGRLARAIWIESRQRRPAAAPVRTGATAPRDRQGSASLGQGVEGRRQGRRRTLAAACSGAIGLERRQVWGNGKFCGAHWSVRRRGEYIYDGVGPTCQ